MIKLDWDKVEEYRFLGMRWIDISKELDISVQTLLTERKKHNMPYGKRYLENTGKKLCPICRHMYEKKYLKLANDGLHGKICIDCYKKMKGVK